MSQPMELQKLLQDFVSCYREFDEHRNSADGRYDPQQPCYFLFGLSGAGKSSLVARFLSDKGAKSFYNSVIEAKDEFVIERGVKVSRSVQATTLIPKIYKVGGLQICDMPGFKDTDQTKRIIISILQKCLVSMVKQAGRYLVVLDIACLSETRANKLINDYFVAFETLFGDKLGDYVQLMYFIFTKNDRTKFKAEDIDSRMDDMMMDAASISKNDLLGPFLHRLRTHHLVVDYHKSRDQLTSEIREMVQRGESEALEVRGLIPQLSTLKVGEDELNCACLDILRRVSDEADQLRARLAAPNVAQPGDVVNTNARGVRAVTLEALHGRINDVVHAFNRARQTLADAAESEKQLIADMDRFEARSAAQEQKVKDAERGLAVVKKQIESRHSNNLDGLEAVSHLTLVPAETSSPFKIQCILGRSARDEDRPLPALLVVRYESDDRSLRAAFDNNNLVAPKSLDCLKTLALDLVLFNSQTNMKRDGVTVVYERSQSGDFVVSVQSVDQFKLFVFHSVPLSKTNAAKWMDEVHQKAARSAEGKVVVEQEALRALKARQQANEMELPHRIDAKRQADNQVRSLRVELEELKDDVKALADEALRRVQPLKVAFDGIVNGQALSLIQQVDDIFTQNSLASQLGTQVDSFRQRLQFIGDEIRRKEVEIEQVKLQQEKMVVDACQSYAGQPGAQP